MPEYSFNKREAAAAVDLKFTIEQELSRETNPNRHESVVITGTAKWIAKQGWLRTGIPPGGLFWASLMAASNQVKFWANHYRKQAFGHSGPHFQEWKDAVQWLLSHEKSSKKAGEAAIGATHAKNWMQWRDAMPAAPPGAKVFITEESRLVEFPDEKGFLKILYAYNKQLGAIADGSKSLSDLTGWRNAMSTQYILAGVIPVRGVVG